MRAFCESCWACVECSLPLTWSFFPCESAAARCDFAAASCCSAALLCSFCMGVFSSLADECRLVITWLLTEASTTAQCSGTNKRRCCLYFIALPPLGVRGHIQKTLSLRVINNASCGRNTDQRLHVEQRSPSKTPKELSNESAKSEPRRPAGRSRWSARRRPAEPEPATRPADAEARTGRTATWSARARWRPAEPLVFKSFFFEI